MERGRRSQVVHKRGREKVLLSLSLSLSLTVSNALFLFISVFLCPSYVYMFEYCMYNSVYIFLVSDINKCSDKSMEVKHSDLLGNYDI